MAENGVADELYHYERGEQQGCEKKRKNIPRRKYK